MSLTEKQPSNVKRSSNNNTYANRIFCEIRFAVSCVAGCRVFSIDAAGIIAQYLTPVNE